MNCFWKWPPAAFLERGREARGRGQTSGPWPSRVTGEIQPEEGVVGAGAGGAGGVDNCSEHQVQEDPGRHPGFKTNALAPSAVGSSEVKTISLVQLISINPLVWGL